MTDLPPPPSPVGDARMAPGTAAMLGLFLLLGVAAAGVRLVAPATQADPSDVALTVPAWEPDAEEARALDAIAAARRRAAPAAGAEDAAALEAAYARYNEAEARYGGPSRAPDVADAFADYEQRALAAVSFLGPEPFMGLGQRLADTFTDALGRGDVDAQRRLGGTLRDHLRATGLLRPGKRLDAASKAVVRTAFLTRWAQVVRDRRPLATLVPPEERRLLLRWKIAANPLVDGPRRAALAGELARLDSRWPALEALAARAANEGDWTAAAALYARASADAPEDRRLRANALYTAARADGGPP